MRSVWLMALIALASAGDAAAEVRSRAAKSTAAVKGWSNPAAGESASGDPEIIFTFDDGPNPKTTPVVLDTLARHHVHAVFFLVGDMVANPNPKVAAVLHRILREGHVIATHTMSHKDLCRAPEDVALRDLDQGKATIEQAAGVTTAWFRVPFGVRCDRLDRWLEERHLAHFHWDLDPKEWKHGDPARTVRYVTGELARSHGRSVLLMHDIKQATVRALPQILDWIEAENARREQAHKKPIRIVQAPALAIERLPRGLGAWFRDAISGARALPGEVASVLP